MQGTGKENLIPNEKDYKNVLKIAFGFRKLALKDFARQTSAHFGRVDVKKYTFRYQTIDLADAIKLCEKEYINMSKAIGIGLNYLRTMKKDQAIKLIEKTYNELENKQRKNKNNITTIAMTQKNWEYLKTFEPKLKYPIIITASRLSKIYNPKKDQFKWIQKHFIKSHTVY